MKHCDILLGSIFAVYKARPNPIRKYKYAHSPKVILTPDRDRPLRVDEKMEYGKNQARHNKPQ